MKNFAKIINALIDYGILVASVFIVLSMRSPGPMVGPLMGIHMRIFAPIFVGWIIIFSLFDLYNLDFPPRFTRLFFCIFTCLIATSLLFYSFPIFIISPKTNLFLISVFAMVLITIWRRISDFLFIAKLNGHKIMATVSDEDSFDLVKTLHNNMRYKYIVTGVLTSKEFKTRLSEIIDPEAIFTDIIAFKKTIKKSSVETIVCSDTWMPQLYTTIYQLLPRSLHVIDTITFYEKVLYYIPIHSTSQYWMITNINVVSRKVYLFIKRLCDILFAIVLSIFALPLSIMVAITIRFFGSAGPILFKQERIGKNNTKFTLLKFRTMFSDAEKDGARWASKDDPRVTRLGKFLRQTRIDELPQIWNIFKGEMSFIGPRPERPIFIKKLSKQIPHYHLRHMVKPGLSGWAQTKYSYTNTIEASAIKVSYDLFYVKRMNFILDVQIFLSTIRTVLSAKGQ